jgi:hypothetical protein
MIMKKWLYTSVLCCSFAMNSFGQHLKVGPEIGLNFSRFRTENLSADYEMKAGLKLGIILDMAIARQISFQPGLLFSQKGAQEKFAYSEGGYTYYESDKYTINYLEIPINIQFLLGRTPFGGFFIGGGPYVAFATGGKIKQSIDQVAPGGLLVDQIDHSWDLRVGDRAGYDDVKRSDVGINLNAGFMLRRGWLFRTNLGFGVSNILPGEHDNISAKNFGVGLSVAKLMGI